MSKALALPESRRRQGIELTPEEAHCLLRLLARSQPGREALVPALSARLMRFVDSGGFVGWPGS